MEHDVSNSFALNWSLWSTPWH